MADKIGKLYGGGFPATGPGKNHSGAQNRTNYGPKSVPSTGPKPVDNGGHIAKGTMTTGTKGDQKGETSAGTAKGRRGNVKA